MSEKDFKDLVMKYQDRVYNTCLGFLKNEDDAEDLAQEVFIQVFRSHDTFLGKSETSTWIYRIAVNKSLEEMRKRQSAKRRNPDSLMAQHDQIPSTFFHPGVSLEDKERSGILFDAISKLPEAQQSAFTLNKLEGLNYDEIGKILDKSQSSVESLLHRAKINLQNLLREYYEDK